MIAIDLSSCREVLQTVLCYVHVLVLLGQEEGERVTNPPPSPLPPWLHPWPCEAAMFLSHSVVVQRLVLVRSSMCGGPLELTARYRDQVIRSCTC